jgi:hypothetical protein
LIDRSRRPDRVAAEAKVVRRAHVMQSHGNPLESPSQKKRA